MVINNLNTSKLDKNFKISDLIGTHKVSSFLSNQNDTEQVKFLGKNTSIILSQNAIDSLLASKKFIIGDITTVTKNNNDNNLMTQISRDGKISYTKEILNEGLIESYEKKDSSIYNGGVFFLASQIDGNIHLFALNVLESGNTGKSVSLLYLPNGKIEDSIMLSRFCYHGKNGNMHENSDGTIISPTDLHQHIITETQMQQIINSDKLEVDKEISLNSPDAKLINSAYPDDANISILVNLAINTFKISEYPLTNIVIDETNPIEKAFADEMIITDFTNN